MVGKKYFNGFVTVDRMAAAKTLKKVQELIQEYMIGCELEVAGLPEDVTNALDRMAGVGLDMTESYEIKKGGVTVGKTERPAEADPQGENRKVQEKGGHLG